MMESGRMGKMIKEHSRSLMVVRWSIPTKYLKSPQVLRSLKLISVRVLNEDIKKVNLRSRG